MLCFVIHGLSTRYTIPTGYFFRSTFTADELYSLTKNVLQFVGKCEKKNNKKPLFEHSLWSCHARTLNEQPRTNNIAEGWHSSFHRRIQAKNPSIWKFLEELLEEQKYQNMKLDHQLVGYKEPETKRYKDKNNRLANVVKQFTQK